MNRSPQASGFTLLEVLIALALSVTLVAAVYGAIEMHFRFQNAGRGQILGHQMQRALVRTFAQDLGCVVIERPVEEVTASSTGQAADVAASSINSSGGSSTTSSSSSPSLVPTASAPSNATTASSGGSGIATSFMALEQQGIPVVFGLVGTEDLLHLTVSLPSRELNYTEVSSQASESDRSNDLQIVTLGLAPIDAEQLTLLSQNLKSSRPDKGLGRRVRDLFSGFDSEEMLKAENLIAPEVTEVSFRYFDSGEWAGSWDSMQMGRLPRAVEVTFGFWNPPPIRVGQRHTTEEGTVTFVHYTFQVALSSPADTISTQ
ncbi:type II secretion system protein GspJ [Planctomicrobium sp. SH668]|uniref:PulJ/GspJ family protein n=1 Tax=Planctomicrobium sp. SH668 TaxID=3448126 RepID=UPI003F5B3210